MTQSYVALLRGINVAGQKKIRMADLREQLSSLPYSHIRTYIQSGNILFERLPADAAVIEAEIAALIKTVYGFDVPVMVKTAADLEHVVKNHPFIHQRQEDPKYVHVTFLDALPAPELVEALNAVDYAPEEFELEGCYFYFFSPQGYGKAKLDNNFLERKLKVRATTRNWRTVSKLWDMVNK